MQRRALLASGLLLAAGPVLASEPGGGDGPPPRLDLSGVGLPVIEGGRIRNYVFVTVRLNLAAGVDPQSLRSKEPYFRDMLVRLAHRRPFTVPGDWTRLDGGRIAGAVMGAAPGIVGAGKVRGVEIVSQTPQRRTGMQPGR